jgi:hypothetical protein
MDLVLACAMQRPQTYKKVLHIAITMGVKKLVFFGSFKVEKSYWDSPVLSEEIFLRESIAALEQCCDTVLPTVEYHRYFKKFVEDEMPRLSANRTVYIAHPVCGEAFPVQPATPALLLVGPEGGFTERPCNIAVDHVAAFDLVGSHIGGGNLIAVGGGESGNGTHIVGGGTAAAGTAAFVVELVENFGVKVPGVGENSGRALGNFGDNALGAHKGMGAVVKAA